MYKNLAQLKASLPAEIARFAQLPRPIKLTVFGVSLGVALIGALAMYFQSRRKRTQMIQKKLAAKNQQRQQQGNHHHRHMLRQAAVQASSQRSTTSSLRKLRSPRTHTPNGDILTHRHSAAGMSGCMSSSVDGSVRSSRAGGGGGGDSADLLKQQQQREISVSMNSLSAISNASSDSTITYSTVDTANMSSADLCQLGMENLSLAISFWEDAVMKLSYLDNYNVLAIPDSDTANLQHKLENLLDLAYRMQDNYERLCERDADHIALESALSVLADKERTPRTAASFDDDSSDQESFVSATDMANLADLDMNRDILHHVPLYEAGMLELKYGNVPCRTIRPEMVQCLSDVEFLAKLHGIRLAFEYILEDPSKKLWFKKLGRKLIGDLMIKADKDVEEFYATYDRMMEYISVSSNWPQIEEELRGRAVRSMSFYDIVLDFILMDAFDDLANPPSTVLTVVQNRWLSNGFKETALATAVWSVLKAKRSLLKFNDGFIAKFYSISEHTSPLLAWGFLGPESDLKEMCNFFKDLVLSFIREIFSFEKVRFTTVEALAEDILRIAQSKSDLAADRLRVDDSPDHTPVNSISA